MNNAYDSDFDSDGSEEFRGREHYEAVEKSRLRKPQAISLGPDYRGSRVSRDALQQTGDDEFDPFGHDMIESDEEISLEVNSVGTGENGESSDNVDAIDDDDGEEDDEDEAEEGDSDTNDFEQSHNINLVPQAGKDREELNQIWAEGQKEIAATLSQAAKADIEKGGAIKAQRADFDKLLSIRIRLQRALISSNTLSTVTDPNLADGYAQLEAASSAAFHLLKTLNTLKLSKSDESQGDLKRKYSQISSSDTLSSIWSTLQAQESHVRKKRDSTLNFWASKSREARSVNQLQKNQLISPSESQSLSDVLRAQLDDMTRLVAKTEVPRSCAPVQAKFAQLKSQKPPSTSSPLPIYDDADFYGVLLQNLVSQRSSEELSLAAMNVSFPTEPWQAAREARTKKVVDTKASKGRRLRYTVHEKLQDSMPRDDRTTWNTRQCDELFASILGRKIQLQEAENEGDIEMQNASEGLRLFAST